MSTPDTTIVSDTIRVGVNAAGQRVLQMRTAGAMRSYVCTEAGTPSTPPAPVPQPLPVEPKPVEDTRPVLLVASLALAKIESGKRYKLATDKPHKLARTLKIDAKIHDVEIDATGATIDTTGAPGVRIDGTNITIIGGKWSSASRQFVFFMDGKSCSLIGVHFAGGGGFVSTRGAASPLITGLRVDGLYDDNLIYSGSSPLTGEDTTDHVIGDLVDTFGSTGENGVRIHGTRGFTHTRIYLLGSYRGGSYRVHDGSDGLLEDFEFSKTWGPGPLPDGDGGERDAWVNDNGTWRPIVPGELDYRGRDFDKAVATRAEKLALRFVNFTARRGKWSGQLALNAGVVNVLIEDCQQDNPRNQPLDIGWSYPARVMRDPGGRKDTLRPAPTGTIRRLTITDDNGDLGAIPDGLNLEDVTVNGRPVVNGKVAA